MGLAVAVDDLTLPPSPAAEVGPEGGSGPDEPSPTVEVMPTAEEIAPILAEIARVLYDAELGRRGLPPLSEAEAEGIAKPASRLAVRYLPRAGGQVWDLVALAAAVVVPLQARRALPVGGGARPEPGPPADLPDALKG